MRKRVAQGPSPSLVPQVDGLLKLPICLWENTESITEVSVCISIWCARKNSQRLFFTMLESQNRIAMGLVFHRLIVLGRGVTDLDKQTVTDQTALAETTSLS